MANGDLGAAAPAESDDCVVVIEIDGADVVVERGDEICGRVTAQGFVITGHRSKVVLQ